MNIDALRDIFRVNLGVKRTERVLVFTDSPSFKETLELIDAARRERLRCVTLLAAEVARSVAKEAIYFEYEATGGHGIEPPAGLWEPAFGRKALTELKKAGLLAPMLKKKLTPDKLADAERIIRRYKKDAVDAVVALSNFSTTHTAFRDFLCRLCGARYASMPLFELSMLEGPMSVDYKALERRTKRLSALVSRAASIEIHTANGTRLSLQTGGRKARADTGVLRRPGSSGNLPAGEVFLAPLEGTANGTLVLEWAPTRRLASPVELTVRDGLVTGVSGEEPFVPYLRGKLAERPENANIAELGIGTNDRATRADNIIESEKILGTIHIALGDNSTFGGRVKTPFHQDFVFFKPTVTLMDKSGKKTALMKNGRHIL